MDLKPQEPAVGITDLSCGDSQSKYFRISCDCGDNDHLCDLSIEKNEFNEIEINRINLYDPKNINNENLPFEKIIKIFSISMGRWKKI